MSKQDPTIIIGGYRVHLTLANIFKRLTCAAEGCTKPAGPVWQYGEGKFSEKQLCIQHYDEEFKKAILDEARKQRLEKR